MHAGLKHVCQAVLINQREALSGNVTAQTGGISLRWLVWWCAVLRQWPCLCLGSNAERQGTTAVFFFCVLTVVPSKYSTNDLTVPVIATQRHIDTDLVCYYIFTNSVYDVFSSQDFLHRNYVQPILLWVIFYTETMYNQYIYEWFSTQKLLLVKLCVTNTFMILWKCWSVLCTHSVLFPSFYLTVDNSVLIMKELNCHDGKPKHFALSPGQTNCHGDKSFALVCHTIISTQHPRPDEVLETCLDPVCLHRTQPDRQQALYLVLAPGHAIPDSAIAIPSCSGPSCSQCDT